MSENGSDHTVGYRRPPRATQFKPGQSGNSKGRPRESKNSRTIWKEELETKVRISENGKPKRITKRRAMVRQATNKAAGGDMKAIALVEVVTREHEAAAENTSSIGPGIFDRPADAQTMVSIVERLTHSIRQQIAIEGEEPVSTAAAHDIRSASAQGDPTLSTPDPDAQTLDPNLRSEGGASC